MILGSPDWVYWLGVPLACAIGVLLYVWIVRPNMYRYFGIGEPPKRRKVTVE